MRKKMFLSTGLSFALLASSVLSSHALDSINEIKGNDRYETAAKIADKQSYSKVILVNSDNSLADGLSASGLSGILKAPILLTKKDSIPDQTLQRLKKVDKVYIIGGDSAVSSKVKREIEKLKIKNGIKVLGGNDRIDTSLNVAKEINNLNGGKTEKIALANAYKDADAMSVSPVSVRDKMPIILTDGNKTTYNTKNKTVYAIGGTASINDSLVNKTKATRLGGATRFETNTKILKKFYSNTKKFYLSKAYQLVDALTGSTLAKDNGILLVDKGSNKDILKGKAELTAFGGIDKDTLNNCLDAANGHSKDDSKFAFNKPISLKDFDNGKFELTFEGVRVTNERNEYSEIKPKTVAFVDYNYKNISCGDDLFITDGVDYKVVDGDGNILSTYPVEDDTRMPQPVPQGIKSVGSEAFAITSNSKKVTIIIYDRSTDKVIGKIDKIL